VQRLLRPVVPFALLLAPLAPAGCERSQAKPGGPPPAETPEVQVSLPVTRDVTDYEDFPGRTEAVFDITVKARVTGYLERANFREGADVEKGAVLFEIDPRPYQAEQARAEGSIVQCEGRLRRLDADFQRATGLFARGAIGREEFDRISADRTEGAGALAVAKAARDSAALNVEFTKVRAPVAGRVSRRFIDPGSLVKADDTALATVVSLDPIYASFDLDERTTLRLQRLAGEGKVKLEPGAGAAPVLLGLADEEGFPHRGTINFADNRVDPDTGTWRLRGLFANADRLLAPGLFVRIRLPIGEPYPAILVSEQALRTDQGQKSVYVVGADNRVADRRVKVGRLHEGLRVIAEGLRPGERVVVSGLQQVRQGVEVKPELVDMPVVSGAAPAPAKALPAAK
jgi:RND family efflux transporter MFP subunit